MNRNALNVAVAFLGAFVLAGILHFSAMFIQTSGNHNADGELYVIEYPGTPCHISTATTTVCKPIGGVLDRLVVNSPISLASVKIYDVASASCTGTPGAGLVVAIVMPLTVGNPIPVQYDMNMTNGICVVTSGLTDVTLTTHN